MGNVVYLPEQRLRDLLASWARGQQALTHIRITRVSFRAYEMDMFLDFLDAYSRNHPESIQHIHITGVYSFDTAACKRLVSIFARLTSQDFYFTVDNTGIDDIGARLLLEFAVDMELIDYATGWTPKFLVRDNLFVTDVDELYRTAVTTRQRRAEDRVNAVTAYPHRSMGTAQGEFARRSGGAGGMAHRLMELTGAVDVRQPPT